MRCNDKDPMTLRESARQVFQIIGSRQCSIETHVTLYRCQFTNLSIPVSTFHLQTSKSIMIISTSLAHMMSGSANNDVLRSERVETA